MDILLEIGLEEIPARLLKPTLADLKNGIKKSLNDNRIEYKDVKTYGTPRRLVLNVTGVADKQEDLNLTNIGPSRQVAYDSEGHPTKACIGFAKSQGLEVADLQIISTDKGEYVGVNKFVDGKESKTLLPELLKELILNLNFPKSMRWAAKKTKFIRPIRWILALANNELIEFEIEGIKTGKKSNGHRFFSEGFFDVTDISDYFDKIRKNNCIIDIDERKELTRKLIADNCVKANEQVHIEEELLEEVVNLVEYPYPIVGTFNSEFLEIPQEILIITMQVHQRYFPILDENGKLLPKFVVVRNGIEDSDVVKRGNEKVIGPRLSDARFFFNEDLKRDLDYFVDRLNNVVFQKDLGTIMDKVIRSKELAKHLIKELNLSEDVKTDVLRTVRLAKFDLMTNMIGEKEYTKLQGFMGHQYAIRAGEKENVALGIEEHYYPRYQGDKLPTTIEGALAGIADKIDTLVGCFGVNLIPSGSRDPYALRRATQGIINVIMNSKLDLSISNLIEESLNIYEKNDILKRDKTEVKADVLEFIKQRIIVLINNDGYAKDMINAVLSVDGDNVLDVLEKVKTLANISKEEKFVDTVNLIKRVGNITTDQNDNGIDKDLLSEQAEKALFDFIEIFEEKANNSLESANYEEYFAAILDGKDVINDFFDNIMVMDKDEKIKNNRVSLLIKLDNLFKIVANIALID